MCVHVVTERFIKSLRVQHTHHCCVFRSQGIFHEAIPGQPRNPAWWDGISGMHGPVPPIYSTIIRPHI